MIPPSNSYTPTCQFRGHNDGVPSPDPCGKPATHQMISEGKPGWVFCEEHTFNTDEPIEINGEFYDLDCEFVPITDG